jgi:hypothetical protein
MLLTNDFQSQASDRQYAFKPIPVICQRKPQQHCDFLRRQQSDAVILAEEQANLKQSPVQLSGLLYNRYDQTHRFTQLNPNGGCYMMTPFREDAAKKKKKKKKW